MEHHQEGAAPLLASPQLPPMKGRGEVVDSPLEEVLADHSISSARRLWLATWLELSHLMPLAGPVIVLYLFNYVTSMSTQIFCGHLGNLELAASSLGNNGVQLLSYGLMVCSRPSTFYLEFLA
uniref:Protein TRANSPARENT TESTA 12 n=1 Tax=Opuntia streptacantha TaxID=393608 RepID=A0A7C8YGM8_OPUST